MKLRIVVLLVLLLGWGLRAEEPALLQQVANPTAAFTKKDGYALLNSLVTLFENLPADKGIAEVDSRLVQLSRDARTALDAGLIDKIFHRRYQRILMIFKLVITPIIHGELLRDLFMKTFEDFVWDTTCEHWSWDDPDAIAKMAAAMEEEFVQMQFYLDTRQARAEFKKKMGRRMLPPPPSSSKKKPEEKKPE
jgi:hypothetical protein